METATEAETPEPKPTFDVLPLSPEVKAAVADLGYEHPTPVQQAVFEAAASGKDLVVQARTGTGKTAAFGLPLVDRLVRRKLKAVQALVLCPTRELALQVTREVSALGKQAGSSVLPVYGGAPMLRQIEGLEQGAQILVGTPGRVLDHLRRKTLSVDKIRALVLDECDEMLSMGFLPQILDIWNQLPEQLQVLLFSATVPRPVLRVAEQRLRDPEFITLSGDHVGALSIEHFVYMSRGDKIRELLLILEVESPEGAIIFCNTRDDTQRVATEMQRAGYAADWLNADLSQNEREAVMSRTREGQLPFLVCTDVAARGIDISHLTHVINFDFPEATEQYVHRTGRTGRAGRMGTAISLVSPGSIGNLYYLRLEYKIHPVERQLPSQQEIQTRKETDVVLRLAADFEGAREAERSLVRRLLTHESAEAVIAGLLRKHLGTNDRDGDSATRRAAADPAVRAARRRRRQGPNPKEASRPQAEGPAVQEAPAGPESSGRARTSTKTAASDAPEPATAAESASTSDAASPPAADGRRTRSRRRTTRERPNESFTEAGISYEVQTLQAGSGAQGSETDAGAAGTEEASARWQGPTDEVFINVGREDGVKTEDVEAALQSGEVALTDLAYVRIRQRHTFIGVRKGLLDTVVTLLDSSRICDREVEAQPARPRPARRHT